MTIAEKADALTTAFPGSGSSIAGMAHRMEETVYGESTPTAEQVAAAEEDRAAILGEVNRRRGWRRRVLRWFDVRRLLGPPTRTRIVTGTRTASADAV